MKDKKYYWIKLKTDFFNKKEIDFLLSQKNGCEYIVLYQMLCLNTANNEGEMATRIGEMIVPYDVEKIVRDTKYFDTDTVVVALELFKKLGLIYQEEDKSLKIACFNEMVGSESASHEAIKKRAYRLKIKERDNLGDTKRTNCPTEYRDKSIENRDKILDNNIIKENKENYFLDSELNDMFLDFIKMRKKMKAVNSDRAINGLLNILNKYDDETKKEMINNSIVNSWKSVYELKKPILKKTPKRENNQRIIEKEPQWMDKDYDDDIMSDEELAEFERQLRGEK